MAVLRLTPVNVGTAVLTAHPIYFLCDTTAEMNALTGLKLGDSALPKDTNILYKAASTSSWTPVDAGAAATTLGAEVVVASNDMPTSVKSGADFVCDGTADQTEINLAIDRATSISGRTGPGGAAPTVSGAQQRGTVRLTGGRFTISAPILMRTGVRLTGAGTLTDLDAATTMTNAGAGTRIALIKKFDVNQHGVTVEQMMLNMSGSNAVDGVYFNNDASDYAFYPSNHSGDSVDRIQFLWIYNSAGTGIHMSSVDSFGRAFHIANVRIHSAATTGLWAEGTPDGHIHDVQIGGGANGFILAGGNIKVTNCKAFYCDVAGYTLSSGRGIMSACECQDSLVGFNITSTPWTLSACEADTCSDAGFIIAASGVVLSGVSSFLRGGGRYATMTDGIRFSGTRTDLTVIGNVGSTVTNATTGSASSRSFVRVNNGTALLAVG